LPPRPPGRERRTENANNGYSLSKTVREDVGCTKLGLVTRAGFEWRRAAKSRGGHAMKGQSFGAFLSFITILGLNTPLARAQSNALKSVDWALHNLDLAGSRFSAMDQLTKPKARRLVPSGLFRPGAAG